MKKENNSSIQEQMSTTPSTITEENFHLFPKEVQDFFFFTKKKKNAPVFPKKYYASLKSVQRMSLKETFNQNPETPLAKVVAQEIGNLPDFIPAEKIIEITAFIIKTWQELSVKNAVAA